jgi:hypothetical protein
MLAMTEDQLAQEGPAISEERCYVCDRGIGHVVDIDLDDAPYGRRKCKVCETEIRVRSNEARECCGHRYVGEDLFRADEYYGGHDEYEDYEGYDDYDDYDEDPDGDEGEET